MRNAIFALAANSYASLIRFVYVIAIARGLGPEGYGLISSLQALYLVFVSAVTSGLTAFLSAEAARNDRSALRAPTLALWSEVIFLFVFAFIFCFLPNTGAGETIIFLFALTIPARGLAHFARSFFVSREQGEIPLRMVVSFRSAELAAVLIALALQSGVLTIVAIHLLSWLIEAAVGLAFIRRSSALTPLRNVAGFLPKALVAIAGTGLVFASSEWLRSAPLVLLWFFVADPDTVGRFAFSWNASLLLYTPMVVMLTTTFPMISRAHERKDGKDLVFLDYAIRFAGVSGICATVVCIVYGNVLISEAVGAEYLFESPVFAAAIACVGPSVVNFLLEQRLFLDERTTEVLFLNVIAFAFLCSFFQQFVGIMDEISVVVLYFSLLIVLIACKLILIRRNHPVGLEVTALKVLIAGALCVIATIAALPLGGVLATVIGLASLLCLGFVLSLFASKHDSQDTGKSAI